MTRGLIKDLSPARQTRLRASIGSDHRLDWGTLFFDGQFNLPLTQENAGIFKQALEMVRIAPSASNKQPWRIVRKDGLFHFYLKRTIGYRNKVTTMLAISDMQRLDMGIAMCHFDLTVRALDLDGKWETQDPGSETGNFATEYCFSWREDS